MLALLSRIPVGFGGLQAGLQGQSGNASAPLPAVCPIRLRGGSAGARRGPVELHVINEHMGNLELLYVAGDTERRYWVIDARGDFRINTREGDVWYLRTKTGTLAAEITVGSDARQKLTIPRCLPEAQLEEAGPNPNPSPRPRPKPKPKPRPRPKPAPTPKPTPTPTPKPKPKGGCGERARRADAGGRPPRGLRAMVAAERVGAEPWLGLGVGLGLGLG